MIISLETYKNSGRICARAMKHGDYGLFKSEKGHYEQCLLMETIENRVLAEQAWIDGYKEISGSKKPEYFV